ncbi:MAG: TraB/GumN family protein [Firmicutes bacterium]|nr:TraB/GumN family protein [Bacillota bacterium]
MSEQITRLTYQNKEIVLIATAHVSKESAELVKETIDAEKPDSICIELDEARYHSIKNPQEWENTDVVKIIKEKKVAFVLVNLALSSYQKRIAEKLDTTVGQEMVQGMISAEETGANLVLADRSIKVTFLRIWRKIGFRDKCKLLFNLILGDNGEDEVSDEYLQEIMEKDMLESALADLKQEFPQIGSILVNERDQHLAEKIKNAPGPKVVAILGAAHVPGVCKEIAKDHDLQELTAIPPKKPTGKIIGWLIPALIVGLIVYGFFINPQIGWQQIKSWILWNGSLAALFTLVSLGHPLTVLTALLVAPISSLNPLLACGWFAGLTEAAIRKPTVKDINNIPEDILHIKGFFRNRFLRILLIVIMANIGSVIGTFVAGLDIISKIF